MNRCRCGANPVGRRTGLTQLTEQLAALKELGVDCGQDVQSLTDGLRAPGSVPPCGPNVK
jgi:hypothetical protein